MKHAATSLRNTENVGDTTVDFFSKIMISVNGKLCSGCPQITKARTYAAEHWASCVLAFWNSREVVLSNLSEHGDSATVSVVIARDSLDGVIRRD